MRRQIADAVSAFQQQSMGRAPKTLSVFMSDDTVVVMVRDGLSPAETRLAKSPAGATQMQNYHHRLFNCSCGSLLQDIKRITGLDVREATADLETVAGAVMQVFVTGTIVYVFLLSGRIPVEQESKSESNEHS